MFTVDSPVASVRSGILAQTILTGCCFQPARKDYHLAPSQCAYLAWQQHTFVWKLRGVDVICSECWYALLRTFGAYMLPYESPAGNSKPRSYAITRPILNSHDLSSGIDEYVQSNVAGRGPIG